MSKIKFLKATSYYNEFLNNYHTSVFNDALSFDSNRQALMNLCYGWADFWKTNLENRGDFEVQEIVLNAKPLQKKWADEKGFLYTDSNWEKEIFIEQIKQFKPDVFFLQDVYNYHDYLVDLKKIVPSIKIIVGWDGILYHRKEVFANCNLILSCVEDTCQYYQANGFKTHFFKFCFEKSVLSKLKPTVKQHPVSFTGTIFLGKGYHTQRLKLLAEIARNTTVDIWAGAFKEQNNIDFKYKIRKILDREFSLLRDVQTIINRNKGGIYGLDMYQVLKDSFIVFNSHGDNSPAKAANMRLIEATGAGACLLTDWKENIRDYFEPDTEIVTYKSASEAIEKIKYLHNNPDVRNKIASVGQKKTFENYSFEKRMNDFAALIYSVI